MSVEVEEVDDDSDHQTSIPPHNPQHILEAADGSDNNEDQSESKQPFKTVTNRGFCTLMKTGRPEYHIPLAETVSHDVQNVFINVQKRIVKMLQVSSMRYVYSETYLSMQEHEGALNFTTDVLYTIFRSPVYIPFHSVSFRYSLLFYQVFSVLLFTLFIISVSTPVSYLQSEFRLHSLMHPYSRISVT